MIYLFYAAIYCIPENGLISSECSHESMGGFAFWSEQWFVKHDYLRNIYYSALDVIWSAANSHADVWCLSTYDAAAYLEGSSKLFQLTPPVAVWKYRREFRRSLNVKALMDRCVSHSYPRSYPQALPEPVRLLCWFLPMRSKTAKKTPLCCKEGAQKYIRYRTSKRHTHCEFLTYCVAGLFPIPKNNQPTQNPVGHSWDARQYQPTSISSMQTQLHMAQTGNPLCTLNRLSLGLVKLTCW